MSLEARFSQSAPPHDKKEGTSAFLEKRSAPPPPSFKESRNFRAISSSYDSLPYAAIVRREMKMTDGTFFRIEVVELASFIDGPGAATSLSDFGARVKVDRPEGELWRIGQKSPPSRIGRSLIPSPSGIETSGVALIKAASAQQVLERLAKWADVFIFKHTPFRRKK